MKPYVKTILSVAMIIAILMTIIYVGPTLGFDADAANNFASLLPGMSLVVVGIILLAGTRGIFVFPSIAVLGFGLAILSGEMNTLGLLPAEWYAPLTMGELQQVIIVLGVTFGAIAGFLGSKYQ